MSNKKTSDQIRILQEYFEVTSHPTPLEMKQIGEQIGLEPKKVRNWFYNRRNRRKRPSNGNTPNRTENLQVDLRPEDADVTMPVLLLDASGEKKSSQDKPDEDDDTTEEFCGDTGFIETHSNCEPENLPIPPATEASCNIYTIVEQLNHLREKQSCLWSKLTEVEKQFQEKKDEIKSQIDKLQDEMVQLENAGHLELSQISNLFPRYRAK